MPKIEIPGRRRAAACLPAALLACTGLTACGGSSGTSSASTSAGRAQSTAATAPAMTTGNRVAPAVKKPSTGIAPGGASKSGRGVQVPPAASNAFRQALVKFASCLRRNGVDIPQPNTSGKGPLFGAKGLKTNTPQFRSAAMKCRPALFGALRRNAAHARPGLRQVPKH